MNSSLRWQAYQQHVQLTLSNSGRCNAITDEMIDGIEQAVERVNQDESIKLVLLTGEGEYFCAGGDVRQMYQREGMFSGSPEQISQAYQSGIQRIPLALQRLKVPLIASVNGPAVGAGFDMVLMCDVAIAADTARFAESFIQIGLISGDGGAWHLPRKIGMSRAAELTFTGDAIDAQQALAWGIVSRVIAREQLAAETEALVARIVCHPRSVLCASKQLLRDSAQQNLAEALIAASKIQGQLHHSPEHHQQLAAFFARKKTTL